MSEALSLIDTDAPEKEEENADPWHRSDEDILAEARKRYKACQDAEGENRINAVADLNFLAGGENQWDATAVQARKVDGRPIITVNSLPTFLHQVTNDQRMNTPAIKVHPVDDKADIDTAKVRQGLIRHIEYDSNADVAYDTAVNSAAAVGFGYFRLLCDYESESSFNQKIMFQRIRNAMSVKLDNLSVEPDGSDSKWGFVEIKEAKDGFKRQYPDAEASKTTIFNDDSAYADWLTDTEVLVCDYYCIETREAEVVLLSNGESGFKEDLLEMPEGVTIEKTRKGERSRTMLYKITGVDILESTEIKCKWIPVFPVYGDEIDIEGKIIRSGIVRHAKGPAQMYNVMMTSATEEVSARAKNPYIMAEGQDEGYEDEWEAMNRRFMPAVHYKPTTFEGQLVPPPQRNPMADVPTGFLALSMHAKDNVKATTGLFDASLGAKGTATSGVQERAQQREGDVANYHYMDGLLRTIRHVGRCINYMIPYYYDTERTVRILGEDDQATYETINKNDGVKTALDMTVGEFDITVSSGPSYSTLRQEAAEGMTAIMDKNPALWPVFGDLFVRAQDWPNAEKIAARIEKTIDPKFMEPEEGEEGEMIQTSQGPVPVAQIPQLLDQMQQQMAAMNEALEKSDAAKKQTELLKQQQLMREQELEPMRLENDRQKIAAETAKAQAALVSAQTDQLRAQAEAAAAPAKAETERLTAEIAYVNAERDAAIEAAKAQAEALNGDTTAFEAWKATLESETRIRVAQIMAASRERTASMKPKPKGPT